jgi:hypothetical protein
MNPHTFARPAVAVRSVPCNINQFAASACMVAAIPPAHAIARATFFIAFFIKTPPKDFIMFLILLIFFVVFAMPV